jgi:hypothetical protein
MRPVDSTGGDAAETCSSTAFAAAFRLFLSPSALACVTLSLFAAASSCFRRFSATRPPGSGPSRYSGSARPSVRIADARSRGRSSPQTPQA